MKKKTYIINFIVKLHNYITYLQCTKLEIYVCFYFSHWHCLSLRDVVVRWLKPQIVNKKVKVEFEFQISYSCDLYMINNNYGEMVRNQNKNTFDDPLTI